MKFKCAISQSTGLRELLCKNKQFTQEHGMNWPALHWHHWEAFEQPLQFGPQQTHLKCKIFIHRHATYAPNSLHPGSCWRGTGMKAIYVAWIIKGKFPSPTGLFPVLLEILFESWSIETRIPIHLSNKIIYNANSFIQDILLVQEILCLWTTQMLVVLYNAIAWNLQENNLYTWKFGHIFRKFWNLFCNKWHSKSIWRMS